MTTVLQESAVRLVCLFLLVEAFITKPELNQGETAARAREPHRAGSVRRERAADVGARFAVCRSGAKTRLWKQIKADYRVFVKLLKKLGDAFTGRIRQQLHVPVFCTLLFLLSVALLLLSLL